MSKLNPQDSGRGNEREKLNTDILKLVQEGKLTKEQAFQILKELNRKNDRTDIAVIGLGCRFPGADNKDEFWEMLINGKSKIGPFPLSRRKDTDPLLPKNDETQIEKLYFTAGYLDEVDKFDYQFFNYSEREALLMDPMQRILLETAWSAVEDSGLSGDKIIGTRTGVYIGRDHTYESEYKNIIMESDPWVVTGSLTSILARRISHVLQLRGPSMVIDTACSSGLVSVHTACQALKNNECDMAIAGGINLFYIPLEDGKVTLGDSPDCMIRVFDQAANGMVWSEGVGVVVLKPLSKALKDRDNIYAVIKGSAINNNGGTSVLINPSAEAQEEVILQAWENAGINPEEISYIETHGSGTLLGDPVEIKGLNNAFRKFTTKKQFCAIGSVKPNIGHAVAASGLASLIKVVLAIKYQQLPATINYEHPNPYINFADSAVLVNDRLLEWKATKQIAGITALGYSGTNCHLVLEEPPVVKQDLPAFKERYLLPLSAKTYTGLHTLIKDYLQVVQDPALNLSDICYTASTGRGHYAYRLALIVQDKQELIHYLTKLKEQELATFKADWFKYGEHQLIVSTKTMKTSQEITIEDKRELNKKVVQHLKALLADQLTVSYPIFLQQIVELYVQGADIRWEALYKNQKSYRVSLPTYPFEQKRLWYQIKGIPTRSMNRMVKRGFQFSANWAKDTRSEIILPTDQVELRLTQLWQQVLDIEEISIDANYFALGGDSVKGTRLVAEIMAEFQIELPHTIFFSHPSIQEMAKYIKEMGVAHYTGIPKAEAQEYYPVSAAQKRLWILNQLGGQSTDYNMPQILTLEGELRKTAFEAAFVQLIQRHEALRTSFAFVAGEPVQKIHSDVDFQITYLDAQDESEVEDLLHQFIRPFDLTNPPLLRVGILQLPDKSILVLDIHHIISDGYSIDILRRDFLHLYNDEKLPELTLQYKDYATWQNQLFETTEFNSQEKYWLDYLEGLTYTEFSTRDHQANSTDMVAQVNYIIEADLKAKIDDYCTRNKITKFIFLLTIFKIIVFKENKQHDLTIGSPIIGRNHPGLDKIIGLFLNLLVLRSKIQPEMTFKEYLGQVRDVVINAQSNQDYPYDRLYEKLKEQGYQQKNLFSILFNYLPTRSQGKMTIDEQVTAKTYKNDTTDARFDITLYIQESADAGQRLFFHLVYRSDYYKEVVARRILEDMHTLIVQVLEDENCRLLELQLSGEEEGEQCTVDFDADFENDDFLD